MWGAVFVFLILTLCTVGALAVGWYENQPYDDRRD